MASQGAGLSHQGFHCATQYSGHSSFSFNWHRLQQKLGKEAKVICHCDKQHKISLKRLHPCYLPASVMITENVVFNSPKVSFKLDKIYQGKSTFNPFITSYPAQHTPESCLSTSAVQHKTSSAAFISPSLIFSWL